MSPPPHTSPAPLAKRRFTPGWRRRRHTINNVGSAVQSTAHQPTVDINKPSSVRGNRRQTIAVDQANDDPCPETTKLISDHDACLSCMQTLRTQIDELRTLVIQSLDKIQHPSLPTGQVLIDVEELARLRAIASKDANATSTALDNYLKNMDSDETTETSQDSLETHTHSLKQVPSLANVHELGSLASSHSSPDLQQSEFRFKDHMAELGQLFEKHANLANHPLVQQIDRMNEYDEEGSVHNASSTANDLSAVDSLAHIVDTRTGTPRRVGQSPISARRSLVSCQKSGEQPKVDTVDSLEFVHDVNTNQVRRLCQYVGGDEQAGQVKSVCTAPIEQDTSKRHATIVLSDNQVLDETVNPVSATDDQPDQIEWTLPNPPEPLPQNESSEEQSELKSTSICCTECGHAKTTESITSLRSSHNVHLKIAYFEAVSNARCATCGHTLSPRKSEQHCQRRRHH